MFLDENPSERHGDIGYAFNATLLARPDTFLLSSLLTHIDLEELSIHVDPPNDLLSVEDIVRKRSSHCKSPDMELAICPKPHTHCHTSHTAPSGHVAHPEF